MQIRHQSIDAGKAFALSGFKLGDCPSRLRVRNLDLEWQAALVATAASSVKFKTARFVSWRSRSAIGAGSTGERQRIAIARALVVQSKLIVRDEPTSALDVSVQARTTAARAGLPYLFITHNIDVVEYITSPTRWR